jgi:hypothetical protein
MVFDATQFPRVLTIYLELSNYPILATRIRERMRKELFRRKVVSPQAFETEVHQKAIQSQIREGISAPFGEEPHDTWNTRLSIVRDHLTDFYFAYNLPHDLFEQLVRNALEKRLPSEEVVLTFHPELAPWDMLFAQGEYYENLPADELEVVKHHLKEIKVVLIKAMVSDHLEYLGIAKDWFEIRDLQAIRSRRLGKGKIGGKAAGVMLAQSILSKSLERDGAGTVEIPESWFIGADAFYQFTQYNDLVPFVNQKYRNEGEIRKDYPKIRESYRGGVFPDDIMDGLRTILDEVNKAPLIVRSSSLLEDSFGSSFAGKYESYFCPNQGNPEENLEHLVDAIREVYACVYSPEALLYRRRMGLLDYDERMGILIQKVQGQKSGRYFLPHAAGVAFSRNQFRWNPVIEREAGFVRLVTGLGTRAVDHNPDDYPRLVALSHPNLRPEVDTKHIRRYSQHYIDLIDLEENLLRSMSIGDVMTTGSPQFRFIAQRAEEGHLANFVSMPLKLDTNQVVITFDGLLRRTDFAPKMRNMLETLEDAYGVPVDTEFTLEIIPNEKGGAYCAIHLLQCRPQSHMEGISVEIPKDIPADEQLFISHGLVPDGRSKTIRYAVYVTEEGYAKLESLTKKKEVASVIGRLNERLTEERFILLGPGRWGSVNPELGVPVTYGDIFNSRAMVEIVSDGSNLEPSYGTHFFQDLVEANIYILGITHNDPEDRLNADFLLNSENVLEELLPEDSGWADIIRVVDIPAVSEGKHLELIMDGESGIAIAYMKKPKKRKPVPKPEPNWI